jgi:hypothetical protein
MSSMHLAKKERAKLCLYLYCLSVDFNEKSLSHAYNAYQIYLGHIVQYINFNRHSLNPLLSNTRRRDGEDMPEIKTKG